ncbi:hypothetical protein BDZ89DRAFT_1072883 [Hymenopellis radicata]|nr:hypothetical protein BDZ89DRAFT_1072883 [Hymenopellis radicata]
MVSAKNLTYDDRDTDHLRYAGFWFNTGSYNASSVGQTGTLSSTEDFNANVTFTFPEPANAFYYFGIPRCCGGSYAICIDCDPNAPNFIDIDAVNRTDDGKNPPVALFTKTFDDFGIHEIILKNQNDTRFGKSQLTIDRFVLQVEDPDAVSSFSPSSVIATVAIPSESASTKALDSSSSSTPVGPIVGGIVGASHSRHRNLAAPQTERGMSESNPRPFLLSTVTHTPTGTVTSSASFSQPRGYTKGTGTLVASPTDTAVSHTSRLPSRDRVPRRETDAGPVHADVEDDDDAVTLPPEYDQVFRGHTAGPSRTLPPVPPIPPPHLRHKS